MERKVKEDAAKANTLHAEHSELTVMWLDGISQIYDPPLTRSHDNGETQGDKLNQLKLLRKHSRSATAGVVGT